MAKSDDTLEKGKMSFLDHLDELRRRLIHSAIAIVIFFLISWFFSGPIYKFLEKPVITAIKRSHKIESEKPQANPPVAKEGDLFFFTFQVDTKFHGAPIPKGTTIQSVYKKIEGTPSLVTAAPWW